MIGALTTLTTGALLGLSLAAPPGPMNAIIAQESVLRGFRAGFFAGLGAMSADACFFVLAFAGAVTFLEAFPTVQSAMLFVGGGLMLYFAYEAAKDTGATVTDAAVNEESAGFRKAFALALTNPFQILWWLTVGITLLEPGTFAMLDGRLAVETGSPAIVVGFFAGIAIWITGFPAVLRVADDRIEAAAPVVAGGSALVLAGFGVLFLHRALTTIGVA